MPLGRRRFTRAALVRPPLDFTSPVNLPDGTVAGSSAITGSVSAVAATSNVDLPVGTVVGASVINGALTVVVQLPAGSVAGSSTISGAVSATAAAVNLPAGTVAGSSVITGSVFSTFGAATGGHWSIPVTKQRKGLGAFDGDEDDEAAILTALLTLA
mgnify:CR=1 FL=1